MKINKLFGWAAAMGVLSLFAVSCDRDEEADVPGKMVEVHVSILGVKEGQSEEVVRSASATSSTGRREIAGSSQAIGDGMMLAMSVEPDESEPLRAATPVPLEDGKTFRVIALNTASGKYVGHADFTIVNGVSNTDASFIVPEGVNHDFICLSRNGYDFTADIFSATYVKDVVPADLSVATDNDQDLLYAKTMKALSSSNRNIDFILEHKLSKVKIVLDGTYNNWSISDATDYGIRLDPFYANATINLQNGNMSGGSTTSYQYFGGWSYGTYTATSAPRTVFLAPYTTSHLIVSAGAANIGGDYLPRHDHSVLFYFSGSSYEGASLVLGVRMYAPKWAGSNIYWNGSAMYFDPHGTTGNEGYQGLFFSSDGTTGVSPVGATYTSSTPVYRVGYSTPITNYSWLDIFVRDKGDICRTLRSAYRRPLQYEYGGSSYANISSGLGDWKWYGTSALLTSNKDDGTYDVFGNGGGGLQITAMGGVRLPASSQRGSSGNLEDAVGLKGYYYHWGSVMSFDSYQFNALDPVGNGARPVRCILDFD